MRWTLWPLLELRRRDEEAALAALGRAMAAWQELEAEAFALRATAAQAGQKARCLEAADADPAWSGATAAWAARLRIDAARLGALAAEAGTRAGASLVVVEARRANLRDVAARREVVERLESAWRRARVAAAARRAEAALDDRPWRLATR